ncbi:MAG: hypothetical protein ACREIW_15885, partial [Chthoniobacterales bacterium]
ARVKPFFAYNVKILLPKCDNFVTGTPVPAWTDYSFALKAPAPNTSKTAALSREKNRGFIGPDSTRRFGKRETIFQSDTLGFFTMPLAS